MNQSKSYRLLIKLVTCAMMTAIVYLGNTMRIVMPISIGGNTAFTLGNIFGVLAGLLLGPWWGLLAAGLGPFIYDFFDPRYTAKAPITFFTKSVFGLIAGLVLYYVFVRVLKKEKTSYVAQVVAALCAAVGYLVVYSVKNYFYDGMIMMADFTPAAGWTIIISKLPATIFNGAVAVIFAPILGVALMKALKAAHLDKMLA